jgi:hypothetical protein
MEVRYDGPSGNVNRDVGAETGNGDVLEHGCVYDVSEQLGDTLLTYDANWTAAGDDEIGKLAGKPRAELDKLAKAAGIDNAEAFPNRRALAAEIVKAG